MVKVEGRDVAYYMSLKKNFHVLLCFFSAGIVETETETACEKGHVV